MCLLCLPPNESSEVAAPCHDLKPVSPKEGLRPRYVPGRHNQDALVWLQEIAIQGPLHHQVIKVTTDSIKNSTRPSVRRIPGMCDTGVGLPQFLDEGEDTQPIRHHRQWISLGHPLFTVDEVTCTVAFPHHQYGPVAVSVEYKPRNTGPPVAHRPQIGCEVLLIERIARVNEKETPVLLLGILLPQQPHNVDPPYNLRFQSTAELLHYTGLLGSAPLTASTHFVNIRRQVSPTTTGLTPGHLSRPMRCPDISTL